MISHSIAIFLYIHCLKIPFVVTSKINANVTNELTNGIKHSFLFLPSLASCLMPLEHL